MAEEQQRPSADMHGNAEQGGIVNQAARDMYIYEGPSYHEAPSGRPIPWVNSLSGDDAVPQFTGRADELDRVRRMLSPLSGDSGPVVLTAVAGRRGVGLTGLAIQAAADAARRGWFGGRVLHVRQQETDDGRLRVEHIVPVLLSELGRTANGFTRDALAAYRAVMAESAARGKAVLVVVDDVTDDDAELVNALDIGGPHRLLLTAHEPLTRLGRPRTVMVDRLDDGDAVDLLGRAITARDEAGQRAADPDEQLRRLAWLCDGLPKALWQAADHLTGRPHASVADLVQDLADAHDALVTAADGLVPGPRTAEADPSVSGIVRLARRGWALPGDGVVSERPFLGRRTFLAWAAADLAAGRHAVWDVVAPPGHGKSTLLEALSTTLADARGCVVFISAEPPARAYERRRAGSDDPLTIELARAEFCFEAVERIAADLPDEQDKAELVELTRTTRRDIQTVLDQRSPDRPDLDINEALLPGGRADETLVITPRVSGWYAAGVRAKLDELGARAAALLARPATPAGARGRLVVLIDNLHVVADPACRAWLGDVLARRVRCLVVATHRPGVEALTPQATAYRLRPFTAAEVRACFDASLGEGVIGGALAEAVTRRTGGSPQAVALACDVLTGRRDGSLEEALAEWDAAQFGKPLAEQVCLAARQLVAGKCRDLFGKDEAALPVFDYLAVMRHVDETLLSAVLAEHGVDADRVEELAAWLEERRSFMSRYDDDAEEGLRLHDRIREQRRGEIAPKRLRRLHRRVEAAYSELIEDFDPNFRTWEQDRAYCTWSRFELPAYQRLLVEWAHHAVRGQDAALDETTAMNITKRFLEVFWWWGCYVRFQVCEDLLLDFAQVTGGRTGPDEEWLDALGRFYRNYPRGWQQDQADPAQWDAVADAMRTIRHKAGLDVHAPDADDETAHGLDVLTELFRAHAHRFRRPGAEPEAAAACYRRALESVRRHVAAGYERHAWYECWLVFECADMWCGFGRIDESVALLRELDELAAADPDMELIDRDLLCRAARLHGDVLRARGDHRGAIDEYTRAAMLAYCYHEWQETTKQTANEYTQELHRETAAAVADGLAGIRERDPRAWAEGIGRMWAAFEPYRTVRVPGDTTADGALAVDGEGAAAAFDGHPPVDGPALPHGILPPPPADADLGDAKSAYARRVVAVLDRVGRESIGAWKNLDLGGGNRAP